MELVQLQDGVLCVQQWLSQQVPTFRQSFARFSHCSWQWSKSSEDQFSSWSLFTNDTLCLRSTCRAWVHKMQHWQQQVAIVVRIKQKCLNDELAQFKVTYPGQDTSWKEPSRSLESWHSFLYERMSPLGRSLSWYGGVWRRGGWLLSQRDAEEYVCKLPCAIEAQHFLIDLGAQPPYLRLSLAYVRFLNNYWKTRVAR